MKRGMLVHRQKKTARALFHEPIDIPSHGRQDSLYLYSVHSKVFGMARGCAMAGKNGGISREESLGTGRSLSKVTKYFCNQHNLKVELTVVTIAACFF